MNIRRLGQASLGLAGGSLAALAVTRRWHQHWGATDHEITQRLPGDDLIPAARLHSTHAITIAAPAERIWPWLAQMGYEDRAGTYSYDLLERSMGRNLDRLDPAIAPLTTGGTMPFAPAMPMTVAVADPPHALVLWQVNLKRQGDRPGWALGRRSCGLELGIRARAGRCGDHPAAGPDAGQLPAGGQVGTVSVAAGRAGPLRHGPPPAARHPTTCRGSPAP
jgi:hypothetical protein